MRIKKFNEGVDDGFDIDYINQCFAELSDEYDLKMEEVESERKYLQISMDLPRLNSEIVLTEDEVDIRNVYFKFKNVDVLRNFYCQVFNGKIGNPWTLLT